MAEKRNGDSRRELSSRHTWLYRWGIPALLTIAAVYALWYFAISHDGPPGALRVTAGVVAAGLLMLIARIFDRAKRVWSDGNHLVVSDLRREIVVDLADIAQLKRTPYFWPPRYRYYFTKTTEFGDSVAFFPPLGARPADGIGPSDEA